MSKSIRSYPEHKRQEVVDRRLKENKGGLGFWAAMDYEATMIARRAKEERKAKKVQVQKEGVPA